MLLNVTNPSEQCLKALAALLASAHYTGLDATPQTLHALVLDMKAAIRTGHASTPSLPFVSVYPLVPNMLPEALFHPAYPEPSDPPISRSMPGFTHYMGRVCLRTSNQQLRSSESVVQQGSTTNQNLTQALLQQLGVQLGPSLPAPSGPMYMQPRPQRLIPPGLQHAGVPLALPDAGAPSVVAGVFPALTDIEEDGNASVGAEGQGLPQVPVPAPRPAADQSPMNEGTPAEKTV